MLISHTTIVYARYILLAWQHRQNTDERTLGGLFSVLCDEVSELDWAVALQQLLEILNDVSEKAGKIIKINQKSTPTMALWLYLPISGFILQIGAAKVESQPNNESK
ncbi:MAG: hypothetical protein P4L69_21045 [Desulfosporosinus sp.]|nr:hypothetical protein [Desulfosporosinus sp.]